MKPKASLKSANLKVLAMASLWSGAALQPESWAIAAAAPILGRDMFPPRESVSPSERQSSRFGKVGEKLGFAGDLDGGHAQGRRRLAVDPQVIEIDAGLGRDAQQLA